MKNKILGLFAFSIFALVFLMGFANALISLDPITVYTIPSNVDHAAGSFDIIFNLTNTGTAGNLNWSASTVTSGASITFDDSYIAVGAEETITATITFPKTITDISGVINVTEVGQTTYTTLSFSVLVTPSDVQLCNAVENPGDLKVKDIDFTNRGISQNNGLSYTKFGDDDEWFPLDEIEVDIEIENNGNEDVDDIEVEWGIYDTQENRWIIELEDEKDFNLKDDDKETITISFQLEEDLDVDLDELDDGDHYRFYVIATGDVDDGTTPAPKTCASDFEIAEIIIESDFVVLDNIQYPETVMCGGTVQITADVWNIGDEDQDEVSVDLVAKALGLDKLTLIGDIDAFDNDKFSFTFTVPNDAEEKTHTLRFQVWDEDNDVYENDFDEDESEFFLPLKVEGNCAVEAAPFSVFTIVESGGKAGEELVVKATITNTGDETATYILNIAGYSEWASSAEVNPNTLTLIEGEMEDVLITFDVNKDAAEKKSSFNIIFSGDVSVTKQVSGVLIEKSARPFLGITGLVTTDNAYLWGIGLLNIILIIIIIIVAVRIARRK